ncbi:hypothetical protein C8Q77DRAFT_1083984 [Trametes polyzona]|nr:hypothetical protein C8Q77DRAFT_1083984 [Trametes polyzona]
MTKGRRSAPQGIPRTSLTGLAHRRDCAGANISGFGPGRGRRANPAVSVRVTRGGRQ